MVEVDIFWAYGLGGTLAAAAGKRLTSYKKPLESPFFIKTVLFLALIWAPTGMLLLLKHPSWETMQVADSLASMPPWLILSFGITNITQGILGFWVGAKLLQQGKYYLLHLNWLAGYIGMFFILLYGWDGLGFDRFLYDRDAFDGAAWTPGAGLAMGFGFVTSSVAYTLFLDGIVLIPALVILIVSWSTANDRDKSQSIAAISSTPGPLEIALSYGIGVFVIGLGSAAVMALVVKIIAMILMMTVSITTPIVGWPLYIAYIIGLPISIKILYQYFYFPGGPVSKHFSTLFIVDDHSSDVTQNSIPAT